MESSNSEEERPKFANKATQLDEEKGITFQDKNFFWHSAADAQDVVDLLVNQETVHFLNLDGNVLGKRAAKAIGKALEGHPEIRKVVCSDLFDRSCIEKIPKMLKYLGAGLMEARARLTVLDLSNNAIGVDGLDGLDELLHSPVCFSLRKLCLTNCELGPDGARMLAQLLIEMHDKSRSKLDLKILDAGSNRIGNSGAEALANAFSALKSFEEISLEENLITFKGVVALAKAFRDNPLQGLNLNGNALKTKGVGEIAGILPFLKNLKKLNLGSCQIQTSGAIRIGNALENSPLLEVGNFSVNRIYAPGGRALLGATKNKPNLRAFNVSGNCFSHEQVRSTLASADPDSRFIISLPKTSGSGDSPYLEHDYPEEPPEEDSEEDDDEALPVEEEVSKKELRLQELIVKSLKCADHSEDSSEALEKSISMFQKALKYAEKTCQTRWVNSLIKEVHEKTTSEPIKAKYNIKAVQFALREAIRRPEFTDKVFKSTIRWYLKNSDGLFDPISEESEDDLSDHDLSD